MKKAFNISDSLENFSEEEANILKKYGAAFQRLTSGEQEPKTEAQKKFVKVARGHCNPLTIYERAWRKYLDQSKSTPQINHKSQVTDIVNPNNGPWRHMGWNWKKKN